MSHALVRLLISIHNLFLSAVIIQAFLIHNFSQKLSLWHNSLSVEWDSCKSFLRSFLSWYIIDLEFVFSFLSAMDFCSTNPLFIFHSSNHLTTDRTLVKTTCTSALICVRVFYLFNPPFSVLENQSLSKTQSNHNPQPWA